MQKVEMQKVKNVKVENAKGGNPKVENVKVENAKVGKDSKFKNFLGPLALAFSSPIKKSFLLALTLLLTLYS
jgi:hypothetical protein